MALKSVWKKEKIEDLKDRLITIRSELESRVRVGLRSRIDVAAIKAIRGLCETGSQ